MRKARRARSCPGSPDEGGTSAVVSNGMVAGSQRQQSFSGGKGACFGATCFGAACFGATCFGAACFAAALFAAATFGLEFLLIRVSEGRYSSMARFFFPCVRAPMFPAGELGA